MGGMNVPVARFESVKPPSRVTVRGLPDEQITATFTIEPEKDGTRVTVKMNGFDAVSDDSLRERLGSSGVAWEKALENLKAHVAGSEPPFPQGYVASLFGYRLEGKEKFAVERSIWIKAPRERVWNAITDPDQVQQWFSPGTQWSGTGVKVGGRFFVIDAETKAEMYGQVIEELDPPSRFVTRSEEETPHVTIWTLKDENGGTRLTLTYTGYERDPEDMRHMNMEQNAFGFGMMLQNLKAVIEGAELPYPGGF
jgi:uncharacterized protein YndB with AHSA1/START domain